MSTLYAMPGHLFRRVHQISTALFSEECGEQGLTSVQYAALTAIQENPDVDATRLSTLIAFDRSTLGDVLERLEARGWIVRDASPNDKRIKLLRISQVGADVLSDVKPAVRRVQERLLAPLPATEQAAVMDCLARIIGGHDNDSASMT